MAMRKVFFDPKAPHRSTYFGISSSATLKVAEIAGEELLDVREKVLLFALASERNRCVAGHLPFSLSAHRVFGESVSFFSVFRNPVDRFVSQYFYDRHKSSDHRRIDCSLDEFLESDRGRGTGRLYVDWFGRDEQGTVADEQKRFEQAVANLDRLAVVGLVEEMGLLRQKLEALLGRRVPIGTVNRNPRKDRMKEVTEAQRKKIERLCEPDLRFYEEARKRALAD